MGAIASGKEKAGDVGFTVRKGEIRWKILWEKEEQYYKGEERHRHG